MGNISSFCECSDNYSNEELNKQTSHLSNINQTDNNKNDIDYKKLEYLDGSVYIGFVNSQGLKHGKGKLSLVIGTTYEGGFINDKYHGEGILTNENGYVYKGEFSDGMMNGKGTLYMGYNNYYEGMWKNNSKCGVGKEVYPDGTVYEGCFEDNKKHNKGRLIKPNSDVYEGEFNNDVMHGFVSITIYCY